MSSRRSSSSRGSRMITQDEVNDLIVKLQRLVPDLRRRSSTRASTSKTLKETCNYIRSLEKEVEDLSDKLSELMASMEITSVEAEALRNLLLQQ